MKIIGIRKERHERMNQKRSRTEVEKELELEMIINAKTIESYLKVIQKTEGRKKIKGTIQGIQEELQNLNKNFDTYFKSMNE